MQIYSPVSRYTHFQGHTQVKNSLESMNSSCINGLQVKGNNSFDVSRDAQSHKSFCEMNIIVFYFCRCQFSEICLDCLNRYMTAV